MKSRKCNHIHCHIKSFCTVFITWDSKKKERDGNRRVDLSKHEELNLKVYTFYKYTN